MAIKKVQRDIYLKKLISRRENGLAKIITGIRRCGKSFLLFNLYKEYLLSLGIRPNRIIEISLEETENFKYHNPLVLAKFLKEKTKGKGLYYVFIDEIQLVQSLPNPDPVLKNAAPITFYSVINGLLKQGNTDIYITGSNSRMLSGDILTEFRGRGDEVRVYPFSFAEFMSIYSSDVYSGWQEYIEYGGMPMAVLEHTHEAKSRYLKNLFEETYIRDILERNRFRDSDSLENIVDILASGIGSLISVQKILNTFRSEKKEGISADTISSRIKALENAFIIEKARRYDVKGRKYISSPVKYYFADHGLRNARLNFRQIEENHIMENIIYNELRIRGYDADTGVVETYEKNNNGNNVRKQLEIDFVANRGAERLYIQSALNIDDPAKASSEKRPFIKTTDSFRKILLVKGRQPQRTDDSGIITMGVIDFLLEE